MKVGEINGWVYGAYVTTETSYSYGETKEQEEARIAAEEEQKIQEAAAAALVSKGQSVVDYAYQFLGNPYVWGGTSLTNGADCSGFVQSVYAHLESASQGHPMNREQRGMRSAMQRHSREI